MKKEKTILTGILFALTMLLSFRFNEIKEMTDITKKPDNLEIITNKEKVIDKVIDKNLSSNLYEGRWCNSDSFDKSGMYFSLSISTDEEGNINANYGNGGPFEEYYTGEISSNGELVLYYDGVMGSISFNEIQDEDLSCKKIKYAKCKLITPDKIQIITFKNNCSYMPSNTDKVLKKLNDGENCEQF